MFTKFLSVINSRLALGSSITYASFSALTTDFRSLLALIKCSSLFTNDFSVATPIEIKQLVSSSNER
jgi:hypothetical protein